MKILMLSWEYPPKIIGGISNHVYYLSKALSNLGNEVHVITCEDGAVSKNENDGDVFVHRVIPYAIENEDFIRWVMHLNFAMVEKAIDIISRNGKFDIIHAHDWLSLYSGKVLKDAYGISFVSTIHATEYGRNNGIRTEMQRYISSAENLLASESSKVVACSQYMQQQIVDLFKIPLKNICIIPNGVDKNDFCIKFDELEFRRQYAANDEKIIFCIGRHVFEKGMQILIEAAPTIVAAYNNVKFVIAGKGPMTEELKNRVRAMGLEHKFCFVGYMDNESRNKLYTVSDIAVFPSLYEPFGIVALEAMAAGCPVIASDTGGMGEVVIHKENGLKFTSGSANNLYENVMEILFNEALSNDLRVNAYKSITEYYTWDKIAQATSMMYEEVKLKM